MNRLLEKIKFFQKDIIAFILIAAGILLMYGRAAGYGGDIWDDTFYLSLFSADCSFSHFLSLLQKPVLGLHSPLVTLSFYLERIFFCSGDPVVSAHCWNIFYFILGAWGLYVLFCELTFPGREGTRWHLGSCFAAAGVLLWVFHPQRIESVVWIAERKDVLLCCCAWWAWALFIRGFRKGVFSYGAFGLFLLSFGIKPMLLLFPLVLGLWIFFETGSKNLKDYRFLIPWCALSLLFFVQTLFHVGGSEGAGGQRVEVLLWNCGNYAVTAFLPTGAGPFHPFYPEPGWGNFYILASFLMLFLLCFLLLPRYRSQLFVPLILAMVSAGLLLAPASGIVRIGNADWADRYNLLPSVMAVLVLSALAAGAWQSRFKVLRGAAAGCFGALLLWNAAACSSRIPLWKNSETVMNEALSLPVPNYRVLFIAALKALEQGDEKAFVQLTARFPREDKLTSFDTGTIRIFRMATDAEWSFRKKKSAEGVQKVELLLADPAWRRITAISDGFPQQLLSQAAEFYLQHDRLDLAGHIFEKISLCYPGDMEEFFYRGLALIFQQKYAEAVTALEQAEKLAPHDTAVRYQLEFARSKAGIRP